MPAHGAGEAMDALASNGMRPAIRSMADPIERCFYPGREGPFSGPDGVFERQKDRLRLSSDDDEVCIHPAHDLIAERRYLIVAGQIAAETPLTYCNEDPARLLDPENQRREPAGGFMSPLVPADPRHLELQRAEVERLLQAYPMTSGAIDVGILTEGGSKRAQIEQVWAAPPGGAHTLFADPIAYAEMVAEHLHELEPTLFAEEDLSL